MFGRRQSKPLLVTTEATTKVKRNTPPSGPALPMGGFVGEAQAAPEDVARVVRQSALVIGFLASGAHPALLTDGVHAALTEPDGCGLAAGSGRADFADDWCSTPDRRRRLVAALVLHQPAGSATGTRTRLAVATWLRSAGFASAPESLLGDG